MKPDPAAAETILQTARNELQQALASRSWRLAEVTSRLGQAYSVQRRYSEAEPLLLASLDVLNEAWGPTHVRVRQALDRVLRHYQAASDPAAAEKLRAQFPSIEPAS
jgi:hypothetical protein